MIRVDFTPPKDKLKRAAWNQWRSAAEVAAQQLLAAHQTGQPVKVNDKLYKAQRDAIWTGYQFKCAYCEARFILTQTGDVEHFRPKKGVRDEHNKKVTRTRKGKQEAHSGYFWLAYDWRNLLPSCSRCNRLDATTGTTVGKGERFPVLKNAHAWTPAGVRREQPHFIHPALEDPAQHFAFDKDTGLLFAKAGSVRGQLCIELLGLNRSGLPQRRYDIYRDVTLALREAVRCLEQQDPELGYWLKRIQDYVEGRAEYALAGRQALADQPALLQRLGLLP